MHHLSRHVLRFFPQHLMKCSLDLMLEDSWSSSTKPWGSIIKHWSLNLDTVFSRCPICFFKVLQSSCTFDWTQLSSSVLILMKMPLLYRNLQNVLTDNSLDLIVETCKLWTEKVILYKIWISQRISWKYWSCWINRCPDLPDIVYHSKCIICTRFSGTNWVWWGNFSIFFEVV